MKKNHSTILNSSSSNANKYGVSTKENHLGMNPNLNIEDEYIENLLKQIHFMNMQIKLTKQKQSQSDSNALWGLINRSNMPMSTNIVQSNQKYQNMKKQADTLLHKLQKDIASLQNSQGALTQQIKFLENKQKQLFQKTKKWQNQCKSKHKVLDEKILNSDQKLKNILEQLQKQRKKNKQLTQSQSKYVSQDQTSKLKQQKQTLQIQNDQIIEQRIESQLIGQIALFKLMTANLIKKFEENQQYIKAKQEQKNLKQKVDKLQKDIATANFDTMQLDQSLKMAELQKDKQIKERKKLTEEYEKKRVMLMQISLLNGIRIQKETQYRKKQSIDIIKAEEQRIKLQKNLDQVKKKLLKNQEFNTGISNEVSNFQKQIQNTKQDQKRLKQTLQKLRQANQLSDSQLIKLNNQMLISTDYYDKALKQQTNKSMDLIQIERELQYLRGRRELLKKNINLKDVINDLGIEDLQRVVQKNNDLNSTVASLMSKWEQIKDFSRI